MKLEQENHAPALNELEPHRIVKAMRIYLGMTQPEVAKKSGISVGVYSKYENVPGELMKGRFCVVYRILEVVRLNPRNFIQGQYELTDIGRHITAQKTGRISHILLKTIRNNCPVTLKEEGYGNGRK